VKVANAHKGKKLCSKKINELFEGIWKEFLWKVDTSSTVMENRRRKM
jgi:hypothetical protein